MLTTRLPNFPPEVKPKLLNIYNNYKHHFSEVHSIHKGTKINIIDNFPHFDLKIKFCKKITFLVSKPNLGNSLLHTDRYLMDETGKIIDHSGILIPLKVNKNKSKFITGRYEDLNKYNITNTHTVDDKTAGRQRVAYEFEYDPELFEELDLEPAIFINGYIPHLYSNEDDEERITCRLFFDRTPANEIYDYICEMGWT